MYLLEAVYYTIQSCTMAKELWKTLSDTYEKKVAATKIYLIRRLYNPRMKRSDSIMAHLNDYEGMHQTGIVLCIHAYSSYMHAMQAYMDACMQMRIASMHGRSACTYTHKHACTMSRVHACMHGCNACVHAACIHMHSCKHAYAKTSCMHVHVRVHAFMHEYMSTSVCIHTLPRCMYVAWTSMRAYTSAHTHINMYACGHAHALHTRTHTHTYMHTYMHTYIHMYAYGHAHACIHEHTHTHIHTYMHRYIHMYAYGHAHACMYTYVSCSSRHYSNASIRICVLHVSIIYDSKRIVEDVVGHIWEEGGQYKDLFDMAPLQLVDEGIWLDHSSLESVRKNHFLVVSTRYDDRRWVDRQQHRGSSSSRGLNATRN
jgi:hypothetical protein